MGLFTRAAVVVQAGPIAAEAWARIRDPACLQEQDLPRVRGGLDAVDIFAGSVHRLILPVADLFPDLAKRPAKVERPSGEAVASWDAARRTQWPGRARLLALPGANEASVLCTPLAPLWLLCDSLCTSRCSNVVVVNARVGHRLQALSSRCVM